MKGTYRPRWASCLGRRLVARPLTAVAVKKRMKLTKRQKPSFDAEPMFDLPEHSTIRWGSRVCWSSIVFSRKVTCLAICRKAMEWISLPQAFVVNFNGVTSVAYFGPRTGAPSIDAPIFSSVRRRICQTRPTWHANAFQCCYDARSQITFHSDRAPRTLMCRIFPCKTLVSVVATFSSQVHRLRWRPIVDQGFGPLYLKLGSK